MALLLENGADVNSRNYCGQVRDLVVFSSRSCFILLTLYLVLFDTRIRFRINVQHITGCVESIMNKIQANP